MTTKEWKESVIGIKYEEKKCKIIQFDTSRLDKNKKDSKLTFPIKI